ncbi:hypothetical protein ADUPG1_009348, partial [Aduncisulcus paluster]
TPSSSSVSSGTPSASISTLSSQSCQLGCASPSTSSLTLSLLTLNPLLFYFTSSVLSRYPNVIFLLPTPSPSEARHVQKCGCLGLWDWKDGFEGIGSEGVCGGGEGLPHGKRVQSSLVAGVCGGVCIRNAYDIVHQGEEEEEESEEEDIGDQKDRKRTESRHRTGSKDSHHSSSITRSHSHGRSFDRPQLGSRSSSSSSHLHRSTGMIISNSMRISHTPSLPIPSGPTHKPLFPLSVVGVKIEGRGPSIEYPNLAGYSSSVPNSTPPKLSVTAGSIVVEKQKLEDQPSPIPQLSEIVKKESQAVTHSGFCILPSIFSFSLLRPRVTQIPVLSSSSLHLPVPPLPSSLSFLPFSPLAFAFFWGDASTMSIILLGIRENMTKKKKRRGDLSDSVVISLSLAPLRQQLLMLSQKVGLAYSFVQVMSHGCAKLSHTAQYSEDKDIMYMLQDCSLNDGIIEVQELTSFKFLLNLPVNTPARIDLSYVDPMKMETYKQAFRGSLFRLCCLVSQKETGSHLYGIGLSNLRHNLAIRLVRKYGGKRCVQSFLSFDDMLMKSIPKSEGHGSKKRKKDRISPGNASPLSQFDLIYPELIRVCGSLSELCIECGGKIGEDLRFVCNLTEALYSHICTYLGTEEPKTTLPFEFPLPLHMLTQDNPSIDLSDDRPIQESHQIEDSEQQAKHGEATKDEQKYEEDSSFLYDHDHSYSSLSPSSPPHPSLLSSTVSLVGADPFGNQDKVDVVLIISGLLEEEELGFRIASILAPVCNLKVIKPFWRAREKWEKERFKTEYTGKTFTSPSIGEVFGVHHGSWNIQDSVSSPFVFPSPHGSPRSSGSPPLFTSDQSLSSKSVVNPMADESSSLSIPIEMLHSFIYFNAIETDDNGSRLVSNLVICEYVKHKYSECKCIVGVGVGAICCSAFFEAQEHSQCPLHDDQCPETAMGSEHSPNSPNVITILPSSPRLLRVLADGVRRNHYFNRVLPPFAKKALTDTFHPESLFLLRPALVSPSSTTLICFPECESIFRTDCRYSWAWEDLDVVYASRAPNIAMVVLNQLINGERHADYGMSSSSEHWISHGVSSVDHHPSSGYEFKPQSGHSSKVNESQSMSPEIFRKRETIRVNMMLSAVVCLAPLIANAFSQSFPFPKKTVSGLREFRTRQSQSNRHTPTKLCTLAHSENPHQE